MTREDFATYLLAVLPDGFACEWTGELLDVYNTAEKKKGIRLTLHDELLKVINEDAVANAGKFITNVFARGKHKNPTDRTHS